MNTSCASRNHRRSTVLRRLIALALVAIALFLGSCRYYSETRVHEDGSATVGPPVKVN